MNSEQKEPRLVFVDGRDALAAVIVKPNQDGGGIAVDAYVRGISKLQGAQILRHVAGEWEKEEMQVRNGN